MNIRKSCTINKALKTSVDKVGRFDVLQPHGFSKYWFDMLKHRHFIKGLTEGPRKIMGSFGLYVPLEGGGGGGLGHTIFDKKSNFLFLLIFVLEAFKTCKNTQKNF